MLIKMTVCSKLRCQKVLNRSTFHMRLCWVQVGAKRAAMQMQLRGATMEATQGQMDGFLSQLSYTYHLEKVTYVGD